VRFSLTRAREGGEPVRGVASSRFDPACYAAVSLARLLVNRGQSEEVRDLLAPVYGWFTEDFDTPDLKDAKALLKALDA
jgi:hypothetical protein